jgi:hypothetical protein
MNLFLIHTGPDKMLVRFQMEGADGMLAEGMEEISEGGQFMDIPFSILSKQGDGEVDLKQLRKIAKEEGVPNK